MALPVGRESILESFALNNTGDVSPLYYRRQVAAPRYRLSQPSRDEIDRERKEYWDDDDRGVEICSKLNHNKPTQPRLTMRERLLSSHPITIGRSI